MGAIIFLIIALWFLTENFPTIFGFIEVIFTFVWDLVGSVVMFFVGILANILSAFSVVGDGFGWLMVKLGVLLSPVLDALPDSPLIPLAVFVVLGMAFLLLRDPDEVLNRALFDKCVKLTYAWCCSAFNLGMIVAASGNPLGWRSGAIDTYVTDFPMTLVNYAEWDEFAQLMLTLTLLGGIIVSIIFLLARGVRSFTRTWVGLAFCGMLGFVYMHVRLVVADWLADNLGFIGALLNIPIGFAEFIIIIQFFFGIVVFLLPMGAITAINEMSRANERYTSHGASAGTEDPLDEEEEFVAASYPTYVSDDEGNHYSVSIDGDFLYINLPDGRISTKWEYIKGQSYFHLNGKRFYPH